MINVSIVWDYRRRTEKGQEGPLEIRITANRKPYYINTGVSRAFSELDALQEEVRLTREKITDDREVFPIARELDGKMRGILNDLFGKEVCEPLFGSMNLFASSGGLPVWANLMLAITDEVQSALRGELAAREQRIAKYVEKYK